MIRSVHLLWWPLPALTATMMIVLAAPSSNALHVPNCRIVGAHRYRYHRSSFHNLHQTSSTLVLSQSSSSTESIDTEDANAHIFLRFSPLIGGPSFLPLHVEVIIAVEDTNNNGKEMKQNMNTIYIRRANNISSTSFLKEQLALHRFDFLPEKPTDPVNLSRLVTLRSVPARVRHRSYVSNSNNMQSDDMNGVDTSTANQDGKGITILIPVGSIPSTYDGEDTTTNHVISTAIKYKNEYKDSLFRELRLVGGKNCLQFALDLLAHIDETSTGIQRVTGLSKLDIK